MVTKQIFNDLKAIVNKGHSAASARKLADEFVDDNFGPAIVDFVRAVMDGIQDAASKGRHKYLVKAPAFGWSALDDEVEDLLIKHLERKKFTTVGVHGDRAFTIEWHNS